MSFNRHKFFSTAFAILIGAAIPMVLLGRAVFAIAVLLAFVALIVSDLRPSAWRELKQQARSLIGVLIFLTLGLWTVSALGSNFPMRSLEATLRTGMFIAIGTMIYAGLRDDPKLLDLSLRAFIGTSFVCLIIAVLESTALPQLYWALRLKGWMSYPLKTALKGFSSLAVISIPLLGYAAWRTCGYWRHAAILTIIASAFLIWDTSNRAAIAGFLAMSVALTGSMFFGRGQRKYVLVSALCTAVLVAGVFVWLNMSRGFLSEVAPPADRLFPVWLVDFERQTIWEHTLKIADQAPWFGIGANTINFTPGANAPLPGNEQLHIIPAHPHNWVMEILAETGILGLSALLTTVISLAFHLLRRFRTSQSVGIFCAIAILIGYSVSGLFNFSYWSAWWQVSFLIGISMCLARHEEPAVRD